MSGRNEHVENGGHVVCLRDHDISEMKGTIHEMHKRMFVDNGKESIQTALVSGAARFRRIEEMLVNQTAQIAGLADTIRQANVAQNGMIGEAFTVEGLVRECLKRIPAGGAVGSSHSAMWLSLATACICATVIIMKVWP
jgi:hypothetical protein